ncbi:MAG: UMP kinase, partial [Oscillospiraceae bacterium]|nr:UMP kinase [Oscillospiraceae bacterium]
MEQPIYKRILLKLSGEALAGGEGFGLDFDMMRRVSEVIKACVDQGVEVGIVVGGGNFWRGVK